MKGLMNVKSMKKYLSLLLILAFLLIRAPLPALAGSGTDSGSQPGTEETVPEGQEEAESVQAEASGPDRTLDELIVGHPTVMKGDFFTEMFGNDTANIDVRALIHGYNLVSWDQNQGVYVFDPSVVTNVSMAEDAAGNHTYYLALAEDLYYSDGTPITAWDYAFSMLLMMSPEIEEIGGKIYRAEHILGYDAYLAKKTDTLIGVQVITDHQLAVTLDRRFLPYFFETGLLLCVPYPISVIAPGCRVYDDGMGVYIGNEDQTMEEPVFTAELLKETILDPETGYNSHPSVVSGPYVLTAFDGETAHFEINPYFKGAWIHNTLPEDFQFDHEHFAGVGTGRLTADHGLSYIRMFRLTEDGEEDPFYLVKPVIEKICFTLADNDTIAEELAGGRLHLVNKVVYGPTILECMGVRVTGRVHPEAAAESDAQKSWLSGTPAPYGFEDDDRVDIRYTDYPRVGLAFLTFTYEWPTVHEKEVRQAIAWCMDRDALTEDYCRGFGKRVDGYYGIEQWEYLLATHQIDYPVNFLGDELHGKYLPRQYLMLERRLKENEDGSAGYVYRYVTTQEEYDRAVEAWDRLSLDRLTQYKVDTARANALLDGAGWTLNRNGEPYRPGTDDVRCKMVDGELKALDLSMMYPEGNHIVDTLQENFIDHLNECGILLTLVPAPMQDLFRSYYRETERTTDMIYLATNFHVIVDPSITYSCDPTAGHLLWNNTYSDDEELYWDAVNMRKTDPADVYGYVSKWITFQERYNEVLPAIPIYSNIYFDFYTPCLQNYNITAHVTWSQAILEAWFTDASENSENQDSRTAHP